jgi:hypothetical protein
MSEYTEYHVSAKLIGDEVIITEQLSRRQDLPITTLSFTPPRAQSSFPVTVYWKCELPQSNSLLATVERSVITYCTRLYQEATYEEPLDCCL